MYILSCFECGPLAQLVEQRTLNPLVEGSIPSRLTILLAVGIAQLVEHQVVALVAVGSNPTTHPIFLFMLIREENKRALKTIKAKLKNGAVSILPAFTIYGFSASLFDRLANIKILNLKKRDIQNPLIVIASERFILSSSCCRDTALLRLLLKSYVTVIVKTKFAFPFYASKNDFTAFRLANTNLLRTLTSVTPITSTSVNITGKNETNSVQTIYQLYRNRVDVIVKGRIKNAPSTIVELIDAKLKIVREGYNIDRIREFM
jgi:L-threonylcarbamoyladenylate synthase